MKSKKKMADFIYHPYELNNYLLKKSHNHTYYKTYSILDRIQAWKDSDCFYLDDGARWNDPFDRNMFNNPKSEQKRFGRCFSFAHTESVAMWMLYGGMEKNGAMLEFKRVAMKELINKTTEVELGNWINNKFVPIATLKKGDFTLELRDILYHDKGDSKTVFIRRSDDVCKNVPREVISSLNHCFKADAWSYESECRLILSVSKLLFPDAEKASSARIPLHGLLKDTGNMANEADKVRIYCSPNFEGPKPYLESTLTSDIDWDLCSGCTKKK